MSYIYIYIYINLYYIYIYIYIQLVSTRLSKNRSRRNALVSHKTIFAYELPYELPTDLKSSDALKT